MDGPSRLGAEAPGAQAVPADLNGARQVLLVDVAQGDQDLGKLGEGQLPTSIPKDFDLHRIRPPLQAPPVREGFDRRQGAGVLGEPGTRDPLGAPGWRVGLRLTLGRDLGLRTLRYLLVNPHPYRGQNSEADEAGQDVATPRGHDANLQQYRVRRPVAGPPPRSAAPGPSPRPGSLPPDDARGTNQGWYGTSWRRDRRRASDTARTNRRPR